MIAARFRMSVLLRCNPSLRRVVQQVLHTSVRATRGLGHNRANAPEQTLYNIAKRPYWPPQMQRRGGGIFEALLRTCLLDLDHFDEEWHTCGTRGSNTSEFLAGRPEQSAGVQ